jgi:hypothetical protein
MMRDKEGDEFQRGERKSACLNGLPRPRIVQPNWLAAGWMIKHHVPFGQPGYPGGDVVNLSFHPAVHVIYTSGPGKIASSVSLSK